MAKLIQSPTVVEAAGVPPKTIREFVGRVNTGTAGASVALMDSPQGWSEPGQVPEFDEYTVVLDGSLTVESRGGGRDGGGDGGDRDGRSFVVRAGQAVHAPAGEWVRYSTPDGPARYVAVCLPAFSPDTVHRDEG